MNRYGFLAGFGLLFLAGADAQAQIRITEWMYAGANGEFIEFTNMGGSPVDMSDNWFYSDSDRGLTDLDLEYFGLVLPGESVILTETADTAFRAAWALDPAVKVIGANINSNLSRVDEINIFHSGSLIDRLTFGDIRVPTDPPVGAPATAGSIRAQGRSGNPISLSALGANDVFQWALASTAAQGTDNFGTYTSTTGGDRANPGFFSLVVPGDYNCDTTVDAADYVVWRNGLGATYEQTDYNMWRTHFGQTAGTGTTLPSAGPLSGAIPEPSTFLLLLLAALAGVFVRAGPHRKSKQLINA
jgi:hypothetical protein